MEIKEKPNTSCEMEYKFHLIFVKHIAIDEDPKAPTLKSESDVPKKYLTVQSMVEFDTFTATHGPGTYVDGNYLIKFSIYFEKNFLFGNIISFLYNRNIE